MTWRRANNARAMRAVYGQQRPVNPWLDLVLSLSAAAIVAVVAVGITVGAANYAAVLHP